MIKQIYKYDQDQKTLVKGERNKFSIILTNLLSIIRIHNLTLTASNTFDFRSNWMIKLAFATSKTRPTELFIKTGFELNRDVKKFRKAFLP